jgi:hypothetical protein
MTDHGRKRGDRPSYPICVWNGIFDHYRKIGWAIWEFLWLIDAITLEEDGTGWVYGKAPFKIERIAKDLGSAVSTVRRNLSRLKRGGYIMTRKARYGLIAGVINSKKIRPRPDGSQMSGQSSRVLETEQSDRSKVSRLECKSERTGDSILNDNAVRQSSKTAAAPAKFWLLVGIDPTTLAGPFRKHCEEMWTRKNGQSLGEFMGACLDGWALAGDGKYPPAFVRAKAKIVAREKEQGPPPNFLPRKPFQKRDWSMEELCKKKS